MTMSRPLPPPPHGLDIYEDKQANAYAATFITWGLAITAVVLRFTARRLSRVKYWWDDWLMLIALGFSTACCFLSWHFMIRSGLGRHIWALKPRPENFTSLFKGLLILQLTYIVEIMLVKCAILAFYWRIFNVSSIRYPIYTLLGIVITWGIATFLCIVLQCIPIKGLWDKTIHAACNINAKKFYLGNSIPNILVDVLLLILPVPYVWNLHVTTSRKIMLCGLFMLGGFVVAVSIARLVFFMKSDPSSPDVFWNLTNSDIFSIVELNIALVSGCLPSLAPILRAFSGNKSGTSKQSQDTGSQISRARLLAHKAAKTFFSKKSSSDSGLDLAPNSATQLSEIRHSPSHNHREFSKLSDTDKTSTGRDESNGPRDAWTDRSVLVRDEVNVTWSDANAV